MCVNTCTFQTLASARVCVCMCVCGCLWMDAEHAPMGRYTARNGYIYTLLTCLYHSTTINITHHGLALSFSGSICTHSYMDCAHVVCVQTRLVAIAMACLLEPPPLLLHQHHHHQHTPPSAAGQCVSMGS